MIKFIYILFIMLSVSGCSEYLGEVEQTYKRADDKLWLTPGIALDLEQMQAIQCARQEWGAQEARIFLVTPENWPWVGYDGYTEWWPRRPTRVVIKWLGQNPRDLAWLLNHELVHWEYQDSRHFSHWLWTENSGADSLQSTTYLHIRDCMDRYNERY